MMIIKIKKLYLNSLILFIAVDALMGMHCMYTDILVSYYGYLIHILMDFMTTFMLLLYIIFISNTKVERKKMLIITLILIYFTYTGLNYAIESAITLRSTMNIIKLCLIFTLKEDIILFSYNTFKTIVALVLFPCIVIYAATLLCINIPYSIIEPAEGVSVFGGIYHYYYSYYGCLILKEDNTYWRLCGIFNEPGVIGTLCGLLLCADDFRLKGKWSNVVLLIACFMSFSTAFIMIMILYNIFKNIIFKPTIKKILYFLLITVAVIVLDSYLSIMSISYKHFFHDKVIKLIFEGTSNRKSEQFDLMYVQLWKGMNWIFGLGRGSCLNIAPASYKRIIYEYGIIGMFIFILLLIMIFSSIKKTNMYGRIFFIVYLCSLYQRPYTIDFFAMIILYGGLISVTHKINLKEQVRKFTQIIILNS